MFTLKLMGPGRTKVVECGSVETYQHEDGTIDIHLDTGVAFKVSVSGEYTQGFVETAAGATTSILRPRTA